MTKNKTKCTHKKVKICGTKTLVNLDTGEAIDVQLTQIEERDFNFHKVWLREMTRTLDLIGNKKTQLVDWLIENLDRENQITYTYRQIADKTGISKQTVQDTMSILIEGDFLRRKNQGCYIINPDIIYKGTYNSRLNVLNEFRSADDNSQPKTTLEKRLETITQTIQSLTAKANEIVKQINNQNAKELIPVPVPVEVERR